jgi:SGNH hydrolase-like domain, acetyltransferase AlgX
MPNRNTILRCGYLLPRVLLLWALLDIILRFAPPQWYTFRTSEFAMVTGRHDMGPFRTNLTYQNSHAYGDLASMGNCLDCRQYRPMNIHTDERGFVNPPLSGPYDAILMGDSFGLGAEQPQDATLASKISQHTGLSIYNACSPMRAISREHLMELIDQLAMTHGTVFFELMDRSLGEAGPAPETPERERLERWSKNAEYSPLGNISRDIVDRLHDGRLMPNPYAPNITRQLLPDGQTILFFPEDLQRAEPNRVTWWAKYLVVLNKELRQRNFQLIVILVPSKYTVYQPLIKDAIGTNKSEALNELQNKLRDVPVVNTTAALQQAAAAELADGNLLYWRDDTHWNAEGVRVAVEQLQAQYAAGFPARPETTRMKATSQKTKLEMGSSR